jgi:Ca-activated chloride channel family protein
VRFLWSDLLWLMLIVPILVGTYVHMLRRRKRATLRYASLMLVREALLPGQWWRRHLPAILLGLGIACALLGAARPSVVLTLPNQHLTVVLAIDISRSMRATDIEPSRMVAAQNAVKAFVKELPPSVRVGIVTFAGTAAIAQTPTQNRDDLLAAVDRIQMQRQTAIGSGLLAALSVLLPEADFAFEAEEFDWRASPGTPGAPRKLEPGPAADFKPVAPGSFASGVIVLMSDGRRTMGPDPLKVAKLAAERGVRVHTVGFGTQGGGSVDFEEGTIYMRFDEQALRSIAGITEGQYSHASSAGDLHKVYKDLTARLVLERGETEVTAFFAAAAALFALMAAMLSLLWFPHTA